MRICRTECVGDLILTLV